MSVPVPPKIDETRDEPPGGAHLDETPALPPHQLPQPKPASDQRSASAVSVQSIGRYRIERQLGQGGFGAVYLAMDDELNRRVAIKVPRRLAATQLAEYREEAQKLAKLEHPGVVPIYDIGHTTEFPVFLVTKFIEGGTLSDWVQKARPDFLTVSRLIAEVAEALHATHLKGIFHRDIKPANILVDAKGKPYLVDFGLALTEGHGLDAAPEILGTPAYMSPEQAAGEGHRVDGQTDIFSLGVVLYELLTGLRPFRASEQLPPRERSSQLLDLVKTFDPRPPRQINDQVPKELERICLKALAKRKPERYTTARDIAEDLRHFAGNPATQEVASVRVHVPATRDVSTPGAALGAGLPTPPALGADLPTPPQVISDREPLKIVPKGLRSFDAGDASFFLDLLPGPRDRDGLPESIRFWKTRIESQDAEVMFPAGVLYGPSGCGKSSLVKAGLIPHLAPEIVPIYLEASGDDTELRLSRAIRRACPGFGDDLSLTQLLKNLRRGVGLPSGKRRALIVLDQFEQWLHAKRGQTNQELPAALRQCDGDRVQCLILVRDDFWLAISRFLQELEVRLVEGENCAMADLFDPPHARKVLDAFGVAFGKVGWDSVPTNSPNGNQNANQASRDGVPTYNSFLDQAVAALAEEGKIISVRLALFAEMVKSKPWTPATLHAIGGVTGVGVTFLEETFSAKTAKIAYRTHDVAVRGVLKALLPDAGTDIKGHQVPRDALLQASGYTQRPDEFDLLLHILDRDLRLITPVDAEGVSDDNLPLAYQLAHDYLVPSIRDWLTKKQKETWRGRAQLRLEERTAQWSRHHQSRYLPSLFEYSTIVAAVPRRKRTVEQRRLMRMATRFYTLLTLAGLTIISLLIGAAWEVQGRTQAKRLVQAIYAASPTELPGLIEQELPAYRRWAETALRADSADARPERSATRLRASLALVPVDPTQVPFLHERLLECSFDEFAVIRDRLAPHRQQMESKLWQTFRDHAQPDAKRFRAGMALAHFAHLKSEISNFKSQGSTSAASFEPADFQYLAQQLVEANPIYQRTLLADLRPVAQELLEPLSALFADAMAGETERVNAASALAQYAADDSERLAKLIVQATPKQYQLLFPVLTATPEKRTAAQGFLEKLVVQQPESEWDETQRVELGRQRAGAAITLLRTQARARALAALRVTDDPESLTQFVARCKERGVKPDELLDALEFTTAAPVVAGLPTEPPASTGGLPERASTANGGSGDLRSAKVARSETGHNAISSGVADSARQLAVLPQFGLLLALGEFSFSDLPEARREAFQTQLLERFATHPSSAIHGACGWLLRHWGFEKEAAEVERRVAVDAIGKRELAHEWFVLRVRSKEPDKLGELIAGKTAEDFYSFVVFEPGEFDQGSPESEKDHQTDETRHRVKLTRGFAMLDREVTRQQFERFQTATGETPFQIDQWSPPNTNSPMVAPNWFHSVSLCRWLTTQMGLSEAEQSYVDPQELAKGPDGNPKDWPVRLDRPGFRLPTEAEWEYACRAGTRTAYGFGSDRTLLNRHGLVVEANAGKTQPVGGLRPNLRGLSDMHGNVFEWCNDVYDSSAYATEGVSSDPFTTSGSNYRVLRGGSWYYDSRVARAANRYRYTPGDQSTDNGVRIVVVVSGVRTP